MGDSIQLLTDQSTPLVTLWLVQDTNCLAVRAPSTAITALQGSCG